MNSPTMYIATRRCVDTGNLSELQHESSEMAQACCWFRQQCGSKFTLCSVRCADFSPFENMDNIPSFLKVQASAASWTRLVG